MSLAIQGKMGLMFLDILGVDESPKKDGNSGLAYAAVEFWFRDFVFGKPFV